MPVPLRGCLNVRGRSVPSAARLAMSAIALTLLAPMLGGCASADGESSGAELQVEGVVTIGLSVEDLGGTALTTWQLLRDSKKADDFMDDWLGKSCAWGGSDISGAEVLIRDADGAVVGLGHVADNSTIVPSDTVDGLVVAVACEWNFSIDDVKETDGVYSISVDGSESAHFTAEDLREPLRLSLG